MSLLTDLGAFPTEHRGCGDLNGGVDGPIVWFACDCGASMSGAWTRPTMPAGLELDARGRRLRAALAAGVVPDNAPELRVMHE